MTGSKYFHDSENKSEITQWIYEHFLPVDSNLEIIRKNTMDANFPSIQIRPMDGRLIEILVRSIQPQKILEIGTLTGYSTLCLLRGLQPSGHLWTIEKNPNHAEMARTHFRMFGYENEVTLIEDKALNVLEQIKHEAPFDLIFIDADKVNYPKYFQWSADHIRKGGLLLADNTLAFGNLAKNEFNSDRDKETTKGIQEMNRLIASHPDFRSTLIPTSEGLTLGIRL